MLKGTFNIIIWVIQIHKHVINTAMRQNWWFSDYIMSNDVQKEIAVSHTHSVKYKNKYSYILSVIMLYISIDYFP